MISLEVVVFVSIISKFFVQSLITNKDFYNKVKGFFIIEFRKNYGQLPRNYPNCRNQGELDDIQRQFHNRTKCVTDRYFVKDLLKTHGKL